MTIAALLAGKLPVSDRLLRLRDVSSIVSGHIAVGGATGQAPAPGVGYKIQSAINAVINSYSAVALVESGAATIGGVVIAGGAAGYAVGTLANDSLPAGAKEFIGDWMLENLNDVIWGITLGHSEGFDTPW